MAEQERVLDPVELLRIEQEAERQLGLLVAESQDRLNNRCPECGSLGSLQDIKGVLTCIDCDLDVAIATKLAGFGRR